jgi:hypothetical protein
MTTTRATLEQRQREIRFSELPRTFKDSIIIARKLKIQYIWIDSLCIIQDSADEWEREAEKMGTVYCNSLVCIAADGSLNRHGGCFIEGHPSRNIDVTCIRCPGWQVQKVSYMSAGAVRSCPGMDSHMFGQVESGMKVNLIPEAGFSGSRPFPDALSTTQLQRCRGTVQHVYSANAHPRPSKSKVLRLQCNCGRANL